MFCLLIMLLSMCYRTAGRDSSHCRTCDRRPLPP